MERSGRPASYMSLPGQFSEHNQTVGMSARKAAEPCHPGVLCKFLAGSRATLTNGHHLGVHEKLPSVYPRACDSQIKNLQERNSTKPWPHVASFPSLHAAEQCNGKTPAFPVLGQGADTTFNVNQEIIQENVAYNIPNLKGDQLSDKLEFQFSEACQKRFIMFDHSGSRRRIIFHPTLVHDFSTMLPDVSKAMGDCLGHFQDINVRGVDQSNEKISRPSVQVDNTSWDARLLAYRETMTSAFAALEKIRSSGFCSLGDMRGDVLAPFPNVAEEAESTSRVSGNGFSQEHSGGAQNSPHEDTEDLDALLSSDEEVSSTGHSPSEVTLNNAPTYSDCSNDYVIVGSTKKRRKDGYTYYEDGETDSSPSVAESGEVPLNLCQEETPEPLEIGSWESNAPPSTKYWASSDRSCSDKKLQNGKIVTIPTYTSSRSSATKLRMPKRSSSMLGSAKSSRKGKIKKTVQLLRSIIPGGDCMDTAVVLDEAIQYVKSLQVKVQKLEAKKFK